MAITGREPWTRIREPPFNKKAGYQPVLSAKQDAAIRRYAELLGYKSLAGFNAVMRSWDWDYYDVLNEVGT